MSTTPAPGTRRIRRVLSTRAGGVSEAPYDSFNLGDHVGDAPAAVGANRQRLARALHKDEGDLVWMEQVHGRAVRRIDERITEPVEMTDAVVTGTAGLVLNVLTADCVPVLMWDDEALVVAAAHVGRPGVRLGIAQAAIAEMIAIGASAERIQVLLGPAVCGACYEVPANMQADVASVAPGSAVRTRKGTTGLDLRAGLISQLASVGVTSVQVDQRCTAEDPALYSYRRDGLTGRQTAAIWIEEGS